MLVKELSPAPSVLDVFAETAGQPYRLLLDSARDPERLGRYSFVAADPVVVVRSKGARTELIDVRTNAVRAVDGDALSVVRTLMTRFAREPDPELPPFQCGAAGYIGYDWGATLERLPRPTYDDLNIPDVVLGIYDAVVAWDHVTARCWRMTAPELRTIASGIASAIASGIGETRREPGSRPPRAPAYAVEPGVAPPGVELCSSFTRDAYLDAVRRVREYILAGDIFQANLSQRLEAPLTESPWTLYQRLRSINPAPFAAFVDFPEVTVMSASPERFVRVTVDGDVEARPIKGTSPRGIGPEHDAALGLALTESEKDRAENLMIVDLLRNDLSRVAAPGTVHVPELFALEYFATVHHLVSTVTGHLETGRDAIDLVHASFPGGSITGAPKVRAMEIIAELEPSQRGVYCGSIGYVSLTGATDLSIVIRTYVVPPESGRVYFSVGGGIVADSDPDAEYRETLDKARALITALVPR
ncbi:MAG TPA: aminodeoxychorismate synthase component I [Gemmatimonadaceae bacterium]|nr:aminodeoxychorismate synthase component I [Gemmatimonadaceae bacterium]